MRCSQPFFVPCSKHSTKSAHMLKHSLTTFPHSEVDISGSEVRLPGSAVDRPRSAVGLPASAVDCPRSAVRLPGSAVDRPHTAIELPTMTEDRPSIAILIPLRGVRSLKCHFISTKKETAPGGQSPVRIFSLASPAEKNS